jgi:predicted SAM-dependent methyltransferase
MPNDSLYVQYGCGLCAPETWLNFDASPSLRIQRIPLIGRFLARNRPQYPANVRYGDIIRGLPVPDRSCAGVYASHVLEHLALEDFRLALANTMRLLRPGGIFRLVVPDLEAGARAYIEELQKTPHEAGKNWVRSLQMADEKRATSTIGRIQESIGNLRHRWMWDYAGLSHELEEAGYQRIRRCQFGDCEDSRFRDVEDPGRFENAVAIECRR